MKKKSKKIILLSGLTLLIIGLTTGFYLYNKGPVDVKSSRAVHIQATELYSVFTGDSLTANQKYTSRVLQVAGEIHNVSTNTKKQQVILIKTGTPGAYVNCTLEKPDTNIAAAGSISIKGICSGIGQGDADLGIPGDVYLTRCIVSSK